MSATLTIVATVASGQRYIYHDMVDVSHLTRMGLIRLTETKSFH